MIQTVHCTLPVNFNLFTLSEVALSCLFDDVQLNLTQDWMQFNGFTAFAE